MYKIRQISSNHQFVKCFNFDYFVSDLISQKECLADFYLLGHQQLT